jgi:membrane protease subunit HflC
MKEYGIEVVDVRIKRTDLPAENQRAIFGRMRAERERQAKQYRSEGVEEATKLRSDADRERAVILAEANRRSSSFAVRATLRQHGSLRKLFPAIRTFTSFSAGLKRSRRASSKIPAS